MYTKDLKVTLSKYILTHKAPEVSHFQTLVVQQMSS